MALGVVVLGQDACSDKFFLKCGDVVRQVFGGVHRRCCRLRKGEAGDRFFSLFFRCTLHDADDALDNIVNIGEITFHVVVVEDLNGLT